MNTLNESPFNFDELFFSRTDLKGIIKSGNSVFQRVSEHSWEGLLGAPHNLIRHPDMPKGVFYLFWKTVKSGQPIGAYVKNRSKSGRYYWVFALALPVEGGYLSIRLKPSSPIFEIVKKEYQNLLNAEKNKKLTPEQSCEVLLDVIKGLGFEDYSAFMVKALMEELQSRQKKLGRKPIPALERLTQIIDLSQKLSVKSHEIEGRFDDSTRIPLNLTIQASRLSRVGDPLTVVANKYGEMTAEIRAEFNRFNTATSVRKAAVEKCQYFLCAAVLQAEVVEFFRREKAAGPIDIQGEMALLQNIYNSGLKSSVEALLQIVQEFDRFRAICEQLRGVATGLEIVRLTGKIEVSRFDEGKAQLDHLVSELLKFKVYLDKSIQETADFGRTIQGLTKDIVEDLRGNQGLAAV